MEPVRLTRTILNIFSKLLGGVRTIQSIVHSILGSRLFLCIIKLLYFHGVDFS